MAPFDTTTDEPNDPEFGPDDEPSSNGLGTSPEVDAAPTLEEGAAGAVTSDEQGAQAEEAPSVERGGFRHRLEGAWEDARERRHHDDAEAERLEHDDPEAWATGLLEDVDPKEYFDAVSGLARADQSAMLTPLEFDPEVEFHYPRATSVDPSPQGVDTVKLFARTASPIFDEHLTAPFADPARADLLADIHHRLMIEGQNLALVTNHGDIVDIAMVLAGLTVALCDGRTYGVLGEELTQEDLAEHCNIMVSRMVTTRAAFGLPAISVVTNGARVFLSLPQTHSRRRARLDPKLVRASNMLMRADLARHLEQGGQLLAMAASGSQDLSMAANFAARVRSAWQGFRGEDHDGPSMHLQPLYPGTMRIMLECADVLPLAVCMDPKRPGLRLGSITRVRSESDCHRIMDWVATAHEDITGVTTVYHDTEDDLLTNIRAAVSRGG